MNSLEKIIIEEIKNKGPITFETFMDMALYYPGLGYYASPETTIGCKGDFYTSPHLHPIYGAMLAKVLMEMWMLIGQPNVFHVVEIGAGVGYLCKDIYDYLLKPSKDALLSKDKHEFLKSLKYLMVEPFPHFQKSQKETLGNHAREITWVNSLKEIGQEVTGCIFSNELLDAFPVHLVEMEDELKEIYVVFDGKEFIEQKGEVSSVDIINYIKQFSIKMQWGYRTEINLKIRNWLEEIAAVLSSGFLLTIDYGYSAEEYYNEDRTRGTLLCYYKHQINENPYKNIGKQDITAHVNFSSLKKWGEEFGLKTIGYCPQGIFLIACGIDEVITELYSNSPDYSFEVTKIKGLILPQGMGESHKVMVQYKGEDLPQLRGFSIRNQLNLLRG
jgi:SAM-dependent MidA family methyltransferase